METVNSFDILIALIKACQSNDEYPHVDGPNGYEAAMGSPKYLLGQSIRQLWNRKGHRCVSKMALELWNKLKVDDSIFKYSYQKPIYYKNEEPVSVKKYVGASSTPYWEGDIKFTKKGDYFRFRQVFHIEHIVPINVILEELLEIDLSKDKDEVYKKLDEILNKIYVCYITKKEDKELNKVAKTKRSDNYLEVISKDYKNAGIEIAEWSED